MSTSAPIGRRERNKQAKLERIIEAAGSLFAEKGVDDVTTQQVADAADIGTGTLFLYARTKGELLLLVQNTHYAEALERGIVAADTNDEAVDAVLALIAPIIECNRVQVDNGRTYLREMLFGDAGEVHHAEALRIVAETDAALIAVIQRRTSLDQAEAAVRSQIISSALYLAMASAAPEMAVTDILAAFRTQVRVILGAD